MPFRNSWPVLRVIGVLCASLFFCTTTFSQTPQPAEVCDNGIDDDGDGLIDVYDLSDCPGRPLEACTDTVRSSNFAMQLAWSAAEQLTSAENATPVIGNLNPNQDSIPEIVLVSTKPDGTEDTYEIFIFKGDGSNQTNPNRLPVPAGIAHTYLVANNPTIADLDADGNPELVVVCADKRIRIYHGFDPAASPCMSLWVTALDTCLTGGLDAYAADFDNDGISELYAGNEVYVLDLSVPAAPTLRRRLRGSIDVMGRVYWNGFTPLTKACSFAADLLSVADCNGDPDCNGLEIAAGYVIYSVDIDPNDGDGYEIKVQRNLNSMTGETFTDGMTVVADVDLDGVPEVLVTSSKGPVPGFYIWNKTGYNFFFKSDLTYMSGPWLTGSKIVVGNVYDDRKNGFAQDFPEIMVRDYSRLYALNLNRASVSSAFPYWWEYSLANNYPNGMGTAALFDFNMDGRPELVLNSSLLQPGNMFAHGPVVLYGGAAPFPAGVNADRVIMYYTELPGSFETGGPVVADVDADGQAEIAVIGFYQAVNTSRLHVLEAEELQHSTWPSARQVWNQYNYNIVNVNDDLSIPKNQQPDYLEVPGPGSGFRPLNMFNGQLPYYGYQHPKHLTTADAAVEVLEVACAGNLQFRVKVRVCNRGSIALPPNLPLTFYRNGNPLLGSAIKIATYTVSPAPIVAGACAELSVVLTFTASNVYVVVNDPGLNVFPLLNSDQFWKAECDYVNNTAVFKMNPAIAPALSLGPDLNGCQHTLHLLTANPGFANYVWQNGVIGPTLFAAAPGTYWVEATDFCANVRRDTLRILADTVLQQLAVSVCDGSTYAFNGVPVAAGSSQSFVYARASGCDSTIVVTVSASSTDQTAETVHVCPGDSTWVFGNLVGAAGPYSQSFTNSSGCDSVHTVTVDLYAAPVPTNEVRALCPGDSTLVFGNMVTAAGLYTQQLSNLNGCDSSHTITVTLFAAPQPTTELRQICPGDSTLVFGNIITAAGVFSQTFSSVNGCDSLHTVSVSVYPTPAPTGEVRQICPGDSTLVFGNMVTAGGVFSQTFSSVNGCDSLHTVTVSMYPAPQPTSELRQICPGDSTLVFGTMVTAAGVFSQTFSSVNGCDSLHTVSVSVYPMPAPTSELRQICPGDSTLVFGTMVTAAGVFSQAFSSVNGCDSLHTVSVSVYPMPAPTSELRQICPGDSTLVFGQFVQTAGIYNQTFSDVHGCDSLHSVTVSLLAAPTPTQENRQICAGDSTLVFGNYLSAPGIYSQHFSNAHGCDSVHTVTLSWLPGPLPTAEIRQICPGDSTSVFGQTVSSPGVYIAHFPGTGGCDSLHTITVSLFNAPVPGMEMRQICPGDSTPVFGQYVHTTGVYSQTFSSVTGCDSMYTILVSLFPAPMPTTEERLLCPGDSTLVFGAYVSTPGLYSQTVTNVHGCDSTHTVEINETFVFEQQDTVAICPGDSVQVLGNWVHAPGTVQQLLPGMTGCDTLYSVVIVGVEAPLVLPVITQPDAQHANGSVSVPANTTALYSLDPLHFDGQTQFDHLVPGDYVLYQQFEGCLQPLPFQIRAFNRPSTNDVYAPNAIQPGSSSGNDSFTLYAADDLVDALLYLRIYDRWGTLVFERQNFAANDATKGWNGYVGRKPAPPGVYIWQAMVAFKNGDRTLKWGDLTLVP